MQCSNALCFAARGDLSRQLVGSFLLPSNANLSQALSDLSYPTMKHFGNG